MPAKVKHKGLPASYNKGDYGWAKYFRHTVVIFWYGIKSNGIFFVYFHSITFIPIQNESLSTEKSLLKFSHNKLLNTQDFIWWRTVEIEQVLEFKLKHKILL